MRLEQWIDQRHLQPSAMASYAAAFASVPYASVAIDNFLRPEKFAALQRVFSVEGQFEEKHFLWGWVNGRTEGQRKQFPPRSGTLHPMPIGPPWKACSPGRSPTIASVKASSPNSNSWNCFDLRSS